MISMLSVFECITHSSLVFLENIKLIGIVNWIFNLSDFSKPFLISLSMV